MSVLECSRNGCESIMCDNVSRTYGYLCNDCKQELIEGGSSYNSIRDFLRSPREYLSHEDDTWESDIEEEFPSRHEEHYS